MSEMSANNKKALIVAFYLSKFDKIGYENLNLGNYTQTHKQVGRILDVNHNTVKNMRDHFDPWENNPRAGWYQRPLPPSRVQVKEAFDHFDEITLREIVLRILSKDGNIEIEKILEIIDADDNDNKKNESNGKKRVASPQRGITGNSAEEYFKIHYREVLNEVLYVNEGTLNDTRSMGCGYDFEFQQDDIKKYIEIKGMSGDSSGIMFTDKEWSFAREQKENYILVVIKNLAKTPTHIIINNPAKELNPTMQFQRIIQVSWCVNKI